MKSSSRTTISIIVPIYNTQRYLRECLDSICAQSFTEWELLLIDDGSTDQSGGICDEYAAGDQRIQVFHRPHRGVSAARNYGLEIFQGEYLTFMDSDDVILSGDYLRELHSLITLNNADVSICGIRIFNDGEDVPSEAGRLFKEKTLNGRQYLSCKGLSPDFFPAYLVKALFRRDVFQGVRFPEGMTQEDLAISAQVFYPCKRIILTGRQMYGCRKRWNGHSKAGGSPARLFTDFTRAYQMKTQYLLQQNEPEMVRASFRTMKRRRGYYHFLAMRASEASRIPQEYRIDDATALEYLLGTYGYRKTKDFLCSTFSGDGSILEELYCEERLRVDLCYQLSWQALTKKQEVSWESIKDYTHSLLKIAEEEGVLFMVCEAMCQYQEMNEYEKREFRGYQHRLIRDWICRYAEEKKGGGDNLTTGEYRETELFFLDNLYPEPWYRDGAVKREHIVTSDNTQFTPKKIHSLLQKHMSSRCRLLDIIDLELCHLKIRSIMQ